MVAEEEIGYGTVTQVKWDAQSMRYSGAGGLNFIMPQSFEDSFQFAILDTRQTSRKCGEGYCKRENATMGQSKGCKRVSPSWAVFKIWCSQQAETILCNVMGWSLGPSQDDR